MKVSRLAALILLVALPLAACNITIGPGTKPFDDALDARSTLDPFVAAAQGTLSGHETIDYRVNVSGTGSSDLLYVELDRDLDLSVYRSSGTAFASSISADSFASGLSGLGVQSATSDLGPQAIGVNVACRGSCVIARATTDSIFVRVTNPGSSRRNFSLFVYGDAYADTNEPANDTIGGAALVTSSEGGAIETIGDVDYFRMGASGTVRFTTGTGVLGIRAYVTATGQTLTDGQSYSALSGDIVRVEVPGASRAAASAVSNYSLSYLP